MCPLPRTANRRAFPRSACSIPVFFGESADNAALAVNLTREGISMLSEHKLPVGSIVRLRLQLHNDVVPVQAIVRHHKADLTGLEFVQISIADRIKLERAVFGSS